MVTQTSGLGHLIEHALTVVGITKERVEHWIGTPCRCSERIDRLNALGYWARRVIAGKIDGANKYLESLLGE